MAEEARHLAAEAIGVKTLPTDRLEPNPHNPRYLFDKDPMQILETSIKHVGILVPLTVYRRESDGRYVILDGERRWICATKIGLRNVPVNLVREPDLVQNIVTMFQIHKLRQDWELMPTALKLKVLIEQLKESNNRSLAVLTGLNEAVVVRCKKLLSYSKEYQDMMLDLDPEKRVKADFFIELYSLLTDRNVRRMSWYARPRMTRLLLQKYLSPKKPLKSVTDFRKIKQVVANASRLGQISLISRKLREFVENIETPTEHVLISSVSVSSQARAVKTRADKLKDAIEGMDVNQYLGEEELWRALEHLYVIIRNQLTAAGRRLKE